MERKRVATQRYGIDVMQVEKEDGEKEGKFSNKLDRKNFTAGNILFRYIYLYIN